MSLQNNAALVLVSAATGFIGLGIGYKIAEKRLTAEFEERLDKETNLLRRMHKPEYTTPQEMVEHLHGDEADEAIRSLVEYAGEKREPVAYDKIRTSQIQVVKDTADDEQVATRRVFEPSDDRGEIYVLTGDEYEADEAGYQHVTWTYYAADGVVTDVHEDRIEDYAKLIGTDFAQQFGAKNDDQNTVHVRNEVIMIDYEIIRSEGSYRQEVLGEEEAPPERPSQRINRGG